MNTAQQLHRENRNLDNLSKKARLYTDDIFIENFNRFRMGTESFTFKDKSRLLIQLDRYGVRRFAGVAE